MDYKQEVTTKFNKFIHDELNASIVYFKMAEGLEGINQEEIAEQLREHGNDEFGHYQELIAYAYNHGFTPIIAVDTQLINTAPTELQAVIEFTQKLEEEAISDYTNMAAFAQEHGDIETHHFFKELMQEEIVHFDDLAPFIGQKRELRASKCPVSDNDHKEEEAPQAITTPEIAPVRLTLRQIVGI